MKNFSIIVFTLCCVFSLLIGLQAPLFAQEEMHSAEESALEIDVSNTQIDDSSRNGIVASSSVVVLSSSEDLSRVATYIVRVSCSAGRYDFSALLVQAPNNSSVAAFVIGDELTPEVITYCNNVNALIYPEAMLIDDPTVKYNCHSYAWYSQEYTSNIYWIDDPSEYFEDYRVVSTPQVGDIVYYNTASSHSAIVVSVPNGSNNLSDIVVQSKWGPEGLYEHEIDQCSYYTDEDDLVFYRPRNHTHTFTETNYNIYWHKKYCTGCGVTIWEEHVYSNLTSMDSSSHTLSCDCGRVFSVLPHNQDLTSNGDLSHTVSCPCGYSTSQPHSYGSYTMYGDNAHKQTCACGYYVIEDHDIEYLSSDNSYHLIRCSICGTVFDEVSHEYTTTYYNWRYHKEECVCGVYSLIPHNEYTETSHNQWSHTIQITCCETRSVSTLHHFEDYDSDSHGGDCTMCSYVSADLSHMFNYADLGNGKHKITCSSCDYFAIAYHDYIYTCIDLYEHRIECENCEDFQELEEHSWDDGLDENGNYEAFCYYCEFVLPADPLNTEMIAQLPANTQAALQSATLNGVQNASPDQQVSVVIPIDDQRAILYLNGTYYLISLPDQPDAEVSPTPQHPAEDALS